MSFRNYLGGVLLFRWLFRSRKHKNSSVKALPTPVVLRPVTIDHEDTLATPLSSNRSTPRQPYVFTPHELDPEAFEDELDNDDDLDNLLMEHGEFKDTFTYTNNEKNDWFDALQDDIDFVDDHDLFDDF